MIYKVGLVNDSIIHPNVNKHKQMFGKIWKLLIKPQTNFSQWLLNYKLWSRCDKHCLWGKILLFSNNVWVRDRLHGCSFSRIQGQNLAKSVLLKQVIENDLRNIYIYIYLAMLETSNTKHIHSLYFSLPLIS